LFSQAQILHLMKTEFARARRHGLELSCVLMQVDRLPQLVDLHGGELRTAVRTALCTMVKAKTRGADLLGLVSDDRYMLVLPHTAPGPARRIAERLCATFLELEIRVDGRAMALTLSLGITANQAQQTMFFDSMVGQAEAALEHALSRGGNQVATFDEVRLSSAEPPPDQGRKG
jgi:diguanylate cyclase (GGDEF)-like protein